MNFDLDLELDQEIKEIIDFCHSFNVEAELKKIKPGFNINVIKTGFKINDVIKLKPNQNQELKLLNENQKLQLLNDNKKLQY